MLDPARACPRSAPSLHPKPLNPTSRRAPWMRAPPHPLPGRAPPPLPALAPALCRRPLVPRPLRPPPPPRPPPQPERPLRRPTNSPQPRRLSTCPPLARRPRGCQRRRQRASAPRCRPAPPRRPAPRCRPTASLRGRGTGRAGACALSRRAPRVSRRLQKRAGAGRGHGGLALCGEDEAARGGPWCGGGRGGQESARGAHGGRKGGARGAQGGRKGDAQCPGEKRR